MTTNETILGSIEPEIAERLVSRRDAIRQGMSTSSMIAAGLAMGSVPVALAALSRQAFAQLPANIKAVLDFALALEIFENEFYKAVLGTSASAAQNAVFATVRPLIPAAVATAAQQIQRHEEDHVAFLLATGATNVFDLTADSFNFTGNRSSATPGPFALAGSDAAFLLFTAQLAEDTGVRAYKGQATNLKENPSILTAALRIHSVEARHAAKIRRARRQVGNATDVIRYSGTVRGGGAAAAGFPAGVSAAVTAAGDAVYAGEGETTQLTINIASLVPSGASASAATEAFDEPLTRAQVVAIVQPFFKPDIM